MARIKKRSPWNILNQRTCPDTPELLIPVAALADLKRFDQREPLAMDLETKGTQAAYVFLPEDHPSHCFIQQVGISDGRTAATFDRRTLTEQEWWDLWVWLEGCQSLFGHNIMFDASFSYAECLMQRKNDWDTWTSVPESTYLNWRNCTYVMFRMLAGEGFTGQQWGLKAAQKDLLGWTNTNEAELDEWMVAAGHYVGTLPKEQDNPEGRLEAFETRNNQGTRKIRPDKSKMHLAPPEILGHYCALDAFSTWQLLHHVLLPAMEEKFNPKMQERIHHHIDRWMSLIRLHVSQQLSGIWIDEGQMREHQSTLEAQIEDKIEEFLSHPKLAPHIALYNRGECFLVEEKEPEKFKKLQLPKETKEPARLTKKGEVSKNWVKWQEREQLREEMLASPEKFQEVSGNWVNWQDRLEKTRQTQHFSPSSPKCLAWLFYEWLGMDEIVMTKKENRATSEKAKLGWGEPGMLLIQLDALEKELSYVRAVLKEIEADGIAHVRMKCPGTVTMRLAGGSLKKNSKEPSLNIQQSPKSRPYLECFKAREGRVIVQSDFTALENVVLAEVTRDENMLRLYGPDSLDTDAYIWNGSQLPVIGPKFLEAGFDPNDPDPEIVASIKKNLKTERGIAKKVVLGKNYGMGAGKLRADLATEGIEMTQEEAVSIINGLNTLYQVAYLSYPAHLQEEWLDNRGFIVNALGLPCAVAHSKMKDLVNRATQSTGHQITVESACIFEEVLEEQGLTMMWWPGAERCDRFVAPWILDFHDEHMVECDSAVQDIVQASYEERLRRLNEWLNPFIPLEADPEVGYDLATFKCEG